AKVLKEAFGDYGTELSDTARGKLNSDILGVQTFDELDMMESPTKEHEFVSVDIRVKHIKVKANLPKDPPMMLDIYHLDCGRYRWGFPFLKARTVRLYVDSPTVKGSWARI